jgi:16S rRNA processing protein RimM
LSQYFKIGKFAASFGLKGEIVLQHNLGKKTALKGLKKLFIETSTDNFLPYFIENTTVKNHQEVFIKLEGIDTMETARKLTPKEVWLAQDDFNEHTAANAAISMLGFLLIHQQQVLGEIIEVIEQPHQILVAVIINGKEALIPIHEASLEKIDKKNKKVFVQLPDGLLDIYS